MIKIYYFAWLRERIGVAEEQLELSGKIGTIGELAALLGLRGEGYAQIFAHPALVRAAVNQAFASFDTPVADGDEIAFFPPVTGG